MPIRKIKLRVKIIIAGILLLVISALIYFSITPDLYVRYSNNEIRRVILREVGIPKEDLIFLNNFYKKIIKDEDINNLKGDKAREYLKNKIINAYQKQGHLILKKYPFFTERQGLIAYIMLRVNGSIDEYEN